MPPPREIQSPCVSVCMLDEDSGFCTGCWRTRDEIAGWAAAGANERLAVLERLKHRQAANGVRPRRVNRRRKL